MGSEPILNPCPFYYAGAGPSKKPRLEVEEYKWKGASNICGGSGRNWEYQSSLELDAQIKSGLELHFDNTKMGLTYKTLHPVFLTFSGAGTGKSRLLDEFKCLAVNVTRSNEELCVKLKDAYVFKVDLENGTSFGRFDVPEHHIGSRMLYQMSSKTWTDFMSTEAAKIDPVAVLKILSRVEGKNLEDMTVMILVDGLHHLEHVPRSNNSVLYNIMRYLSCMMNGSGDKGNPFIICCFAALVKTPVSEFLSASSQLHKQLALPIIDGKKIIDTKDDAVKDLLVDDMGGHGRALEVLKLELDKYGDTDYSSITLMNDVRNNLKQLYPHWGEYNEDIKPILSAVITGRKFDGPMEEYCGHRIEEYTKCGLLRWNKITNKLDCPFIWLWLVSEHYSDLRSLLWVEGVYTQAEYLENPEVCPQGFACWQHWEVFTAQFWCLKTSVYNGAEIGWHKLHSGAKFGKGKEPMVHVKKLEYRKAVEHCPIASDKALRSVQTENGIIDPFNCEAHILPAENNPGGDSYCFIKECLPNGSHRKVTFAMSNKKTKVRRGMTDFTFEKQKSSSEYDLFIEFTTGSYDFSGHTSNSRCGIVSSSEFKEYFGPLAGRAFFIVRNPVPNINTATLSHLEAVSGIGRNLASWILEKRPFVSLDDAVRRVKGLGRRKAALLHYKD